MLQCLEVCEAVSLQLYIKLNVNSKLTYPKTFSNDARIVELKGEEMLFCIFINRKQMGEMF